MNKEAVDWESLARYVGGGALAGGGLSALYHYIRDFNRMKSEATVDTSKDDDVLYIKSKKKEDEKSASTRDDSGFGKFLNATGAVGGSIAGYQGVRWLYDMVRDKSLQKEMDDAQIAYMEALQDKRDKERKKYASINKEAFGENIEAGTYGALLLLALASGVISYKTLDEAFPKRSMPNQLGGKYRPVGGRSIKVQRPVDYPKAIHVMGEDDKVVRKIRTDEKPTDAEEIESLIRTTTADPEISKKAGFDDLITAVASGRADEIKDNLSYGLNHAFKMIKGAAKTNVSDVKKNIAIGVIARDPLLKSAFAPLFAAEYRNMSPYMFHTASMLSDQEKDFLSKVACEYNKAFRAARLIESPEIKEAVQNLPEESGEKTAAAIARSFFGVNKALKSSLDEGTSFFASGDDSDSSEFESEEDPEEYDETDEVDGFFDGKMEDVEDEK